MARFNPFQNSTKEEKEAREAAAIEAVKRLNEVKDAARACLKLDEFKLYRERYEKAEASLIAMLLSVDEADPVRKAMIVTDLQAKLRTLRSLLVDVTKDAK